MEDVVRSRAQIHSAVQPRIPDDDDDGRVDFDDNKSKASKGSSYWSADKITLQNPIPKQRPGRNGPIVPSARRRERGYSRESSTLNLVIA
jgi:hypothetical protein